MFIAKVNITLKESVLDPQGQTVLRVLKGRGESCVQDVRIGKYVEIQLDSQTLEEATQTAQRICENLLANPVIESYELHIEEK